MILKPSLGVNIKDCGSGVLNDKRWRVSEKIDGVRRLFYKSQNGTIEAYSRSGKVDIYLNHIMEFLESPWFPCNCVYDCELVDREAYFSNKESFLVRVATTSKANKKSFDEKTDLMALCFDVILLDRADNGDERTDLLYDLFSRGLMSDPIILVPILGNVKGEDISGINTLLELVYAHNGEGLMLMNLNEAYIQGRSSNLIKIKKVEEFLGEIVDIEMAREDSKIHDGVAALICTVPCCSVPVRVGTGMTNLMRRTMATFYDEGDLIGKKVEIEAFCISSDAMGNTSLSMPVFKRLILDSQGCDL